MTTLKNPSRFIAFFDECGDHSLEKIDQDFPIFVLSTIVVKRTSYIEKIIPALTKLKLKFWNHEGVNLHSRDIRRALRDFSFMQVPQMRNAMLDELESMMKDLPFALFLAIIDKEKHKKQHGSDTVNPYDLALGYTLKNLEIFLKENNENTLPIIAESRGNNEDDQLRTSLCKLMSELEIPKITRQPQSSNFPITFRKKNDNIAGIQLADLCAYPAARKFLNPDKENRAFDIIHPHIYVHAELSVLKQEGGSREKL